MPIGLLHQPSTSLSSTCLSLSALALKSQLGLSLGVVHDLILSMGISFMIDNIELQSYVHASMIASARIL